MSKSRSAFSLVEVNFALLVVAGGMLSLFALFSGGLRQSMNSKTDLSESTFASSLLGSIAGNVRMIDDVAVWNDPEEWWKIAVKGTGVPDNLNGYKLSKFKGASSSFSKSTRWLYNKYGDYTDSEIDKEYDGWLWYVGRDGFEWESDNGELVLPPQYLIRIVCCDRVYSGAVLEDDLPENGGVPYRYLVSVVSSDHQLPEVYCYEPFFSQEYTFLHRP